MIEAGEDPRFIARRIVIHAAEDVGLADPMALVLAVARTTPPNSSAGPRPALPLPKPRFISPPRIRATVSLPPSTPRWLTCGPGAPCRSPNTCGTRVIPAPSGSAMARATNTPRSSRPFRAQDYLGAARKYYEPTEQGVEKKIKDRVEKWRAALEAARGQTNPPKP